MNEGRREDRASFSDEIGFDGVLSVELAGIIGLKLATPPNIFFNRYGVI